MESGFTTATGPPPSPTQVLLPHYHTRPLPSQTQALKNQIGLLQGVAAISEPSADEAKLAHVWRLSMARFNDWEAGKGDYAGILEELKVIAAGVQASVADDAQWRTALAKYLSRMQEVASLHLCPRPWSYKRISSGLGGGGGALDTVCLCLLVFACMRKMGPFPVK